MKVESKECPRAKTVLSPRNPAPHPRPPRPHHRGLEKYRLSCGTSSGLRNLLKALVWFWLIDETLNANLVYQGDYEIGSTTPSDEAMMKIMTMVMAW